LAGSLPADGAQIRTLIRRRAGPHEIDRSNPAFFDPPDEWSAATLSWTSKARTQLADCGQGFRKNV
jgi:hypothetical protein